MIVSNKDAMSSLYDIVKSLATGNSPIPIYKWNMTEDENSIPESYILLRSEITDTTKTYGDGKTLIRSSDCDIILISKGMVSSSNELHIRNINRIKTLLKSNEINYIGSDLGYDNNLKATQYTFSVTINYMG